MVYLLIAWWIFPWLTGNVITSYITSNGAFFPTCFSHGRAGDIRRSPGHPFTGHPKNRLQPQEKPGKKAMKKPPVARRLPTVSDSIRGTVQWLQTLFLIRLKQCKHIGNWACVRPNQNRKPSQWYWEYEWRHHNKQQRKALQQQNEENRTSTSEFP